MSFMIKGRTFEVGLCRWGFEHVRWPSTEFFGYLVPWEVYQEVGFVCFHTHKGISIIL